LIWSVSFRRPMSTSTTAISVRGCVVNMMYVPVSRAQQVNIYSIAAICAASRLALDGKSLGVTHLLRTRPDIVYYPPLDRTPLFALLPIAAHTAPTIFAPKRPAAKKWLITSLRGAAGS
jgi:hypothetical protein